MTTLSHLEKTIQIVQRCTIWGKANVAPVHHLRRGKFCNVAEFEKGEAMGNEREQTTIRLPAELKEQLQREADMRGISFNAYLLLLIDKARRC